MPGLGMPSPRTLALEAFHRKGWSIDRIASHLDVSQEKVTDWVYGRRRKPLARSAGKRRRQSISPASRKQREKVKLAVSIVSGEEGCDPMHVWPRSLGGCDDPLCVVPATRSEHSAYDSRRLDLLPHLIRAGCVAELQHALGHANGNLRTLLERVTNSRWQPANEEDSP